MTAIRNEASPALDAPIGARAATRRRPVVAIVLAAVAVLALPLLLLSRTGRVRGRSADRAH